MIRTYSEMSQLKTLEERYEYLKLEDGHVGEDTFGWDRYLNQKFYASPEWRKLRRDLIIRDNGSELGLEDYPIAGRVIIHHMNPLRANDIVDRTEYLMNPDYLVCVSQAMHNAIHYGDANQIPKDPISRSPGDTCPWKKTT